MAGSGPETPRNAAASSQLWNARAGTPSACMLREAWAA